jgi:hypothetical protein
VISVADDFDVHLARGHGRPSAVRFAWLPTDG